MGTTRGYSSPWKNPKGQNRRSQTHLGTSLWVQPYYAGLSGGIGRIVCGAWIGIAHKPLRTIRDVISKLKDLIPTGHKSGVVYHSSCKDCDQFDIGEAGRNLKQRLDEHYGTIRLGKVTQSAI